MVRALRIIDWHYVLLRGPFGASHTFAYSHTGGWEEEWDIHVQHHHLVSSYMLLFDADDEVVAPT